MVADVQNISCDKLSGVGPKTLERLHKLGLFTAQDLLFHLPIRYEDRTKVSAIRSLRVGDYAVIEGVITHVEMVHRNRPILYCTLQDHSGSLQVCFFNFAKQKLQFKLQPGVRLYCYGELRWAGSRPTMAHPEYRILQNDELPPLSDTLTPVYPTTDGLSQFVLRKIVSQVINIISKKKTDFVFFPEEVLHKFKFSNLLEALSFVHRPKAGQSIDEVLDHKHPMRQRLIFEELLAQQLSLLKLRMEGKRHSAPSLSWNKEFTNKFLSGLAFTLTNAQSRVIEEISQDLQKPSPMLRLLQGDVGCGKTVVATLAMAQVVHNGYQAAIMVPTELLAEQHYKNVSKMLEPFGIKTVLFSGKIKGKKRQAIMGEIANGSAQIVVGTHALFQEKVIFKNLVLAVIDEQHRFGVHQRLQLQEKGRHVDNYPHQLIMTATPIPRTLTMTIYADLDCSVIDELPKNRASVTTLVISNKRRSEVLKHIRDNCRAGKQAYWVCPLIEESENLECQAAETLAQDLIIQLPELKIGLVHGRKKSEEKGKIMADFLAHKIDLLVATTVIEVGVDVKNASLMVIENDFV